MATTRINGATQIKAGTITELECDGSIEKVVNKGIANGYTPLGSDTLVPADHLGTGTPSSSKFLRGDQTWSDMGEISIRLFEPDINGDLMPIIGTAIDPVWELDINGDIMSRS